MAGTAASLWPWLAVAGAGALHGLNPCSGWALAAACGWRAGDARQALRALGPIAAGHAASVGAVAAAVALGLAMDALPALAGLGAAGLLPWLLDRRRRRGTGLALGSFVTTTLQGSGLMLVPAFVPLCLSASPARAITASGSLGLARARPGRHGLAHGGDADSHRAARLRGPPRRGGGAGVTQATLGGRRHGAPRGRLC